MRLITCRTCGREFDPIAKRKLYRGGYYNQCASCSRKSGDAERKYLGRPGAINKSGNITIFRNNLETIRAQITYENRVGRNPNIRLNSPKTPSWEELQELWEE
jgi:DNA-directed RNA polymerase subunit RPC12/RpoP